MAFGTLTLADLQATALNSTVAQVGEDKTFEAISNSLAAHNTIMEGMFGQLAERTTDRLRRYGGVATMTMEDGDELAMPFAQKVTGGSNVGFPLNSAIGGLQWSEMWFKKHTIGELTAQVEAMMTADVARVMRDIKRALFYATNATAYDHLIDNIALGVKRLVNADSEPLPPGPNGETFTASSHTHYIARISTFAATDLDSLINHVKEHFAVGEIVVQINQASESAVRAFTGFVPMVDARVIQAYATDRVVPGMSLDPLQIYNRTIGIYNGAMIEVKPWIPANYLACFNTGDNIPKPLCYRYDADYGDGLQLVYDNPSYPLRAKGYRRIFGVGVWNRVNGAVLYTGGTSYTDPTIS
jgi:hypothetical protein